MSGSGADLQRRPQIFASFVLLRTSAQSSAEYSLPLITAIGLLAAGFVWLNTANSQVAVAGFVLLYAIGTSLSWPFTQAYFNHAVPKHKLSQLLSIRNMLAQLLSLGVFAALNALDPWLQFKRVPRNGLTGACRGDWVGD